MQSVWTISISELFASLEGDLHVYMHKESLIEKLNLLLFLTRAPEYEETLCKKCGLSPTFFVGIISVIVEVIGQGPMSVPVHFCMFLHNFYYHNAF